MSANQLINIWGCHKEGLIGIVKGQRIIYKGVLRKSYK